MDDFFKSAKSIDNVLEFLQPLVAMMKLSGLIRRNGFYMKGKRYNAAQNQKELPLRKSLEELSFYLPNVPLVTLRCQLGLFWLCDQNRPCRSSSSRYSAL